MEFRCNTSIGDRGTTLVKINLQENGIYIFDSETATGKTRLFKCLRELQAAGEPIITYTYEDNLQGQSLTSVLQEHKCKLVMLDRYDMYQGEGSEAILACAESSIILIDCNDIFSVTTEDKWCYIKMENSTLEVLD